MELTFRTVTMPAAISPATAATLADDLARALADAGVRGLILEGGPAEFCRGMDLTAIARRASEPAPEKGPGIPAFADALCLLADAPKPTLAVVRGAALGGGLGIAAACDVILAARSATFGLPEGLFGLAPAGIAPVLLRRITGARFRRLALTAEPIAADAALAIGLADEVVEDAAVSARRDRLVTVLSRVHPRTKSVVLDAIAHAREDTLGAAVQWGVDETARASRSPDVGEAIARFLEGGAPWGT